MDKNYLNGLEGSPYVDEGLFDRVKARGASVMQRYKGIAGTGWKPLDETKIESLWNSFTKKVAKILQDFNVNVIPTIRQHRPQELVPYQADITKFEKLGSLLKAGPRQFANPQLQNMLNPRRSGDPSHLSQSGVNQGVNFSEMLSEAGIGKFFRAPALTQALQSNDLGRVISAYKGQLKKLYNDFTNDVNHITKTPPEYVGRNIVTQKPDWASTLNQVEDLAGLPQSNPPTTARAQAGTSPSGQASVAPGEAPQPSPESPQATGGEPPTGKTPPPYKGGEDESKLPGALDITVLEKVIKLIIARVKEDVKRSSRYMDVSTGSWKAKQSTEAPPVDFPKPVKEADEEDPDPAVSIGKEPSDPKNPEDAKTFLYRFRQEYRKHTGSFTYRVGVFEHKGRIYEVLWHSFGPGEKGHGHNNDIRVKVYDKANPKAPPQTIILFSFFDHHIDPREPAASDFNIPKLFMKANPQIQNPFTPEDIALLKKYEEIFHRALFAVTDRKTLEYKLALPVKGREAFKRLLTLGWNETEAEHYVGLAIKQLGTNADPEDLVERAEDIRQADKGGTAIFKKTPAMKDAELALTAMGISKEDARKFVRQAVAQLGNSADASALSTLAMKLSKNPKATTTPAPAPAPAKPAPSAAVTPPKATPQGSPTIHNDGTVEYGGKKWKYPQAIPDKVRQLIKSTGQQEKYDAILEPLKAKTKEKKAIGKAKAKAASSKKGLSELINPFVSSNFVY